MSANSPVEITTKYVTNVDDLSAAWAFVMERLESVGPDPYIEIKPFWIVSVGDAIDALDGGDEPEPPREFSVIVSGMVKEGAEPERGAR